MESLATDRKTVWNMHASDVNACPWHRRCFCQIELVKRSCWSLPPPEIASLPPFLSCPKTVFSKIPLSLWTTHFPVTCWYSAFRQKFPKLWTSVAHSFLQQIAQNKNWAHPKATTLPRICKVEMQQASLLYCSAKPQSGGILGCALVCPTSLYVRNIRFPTFCRSLPSVGPYSQYPAWSGCRRSADVPRADHDRVGSSRG